MSKKKNPPKWVNVYPQGTPEGNEEQKLFISLARHPKYEWRSVSALSAESSLSKKRVEEILAKYYKKGMVFQNPKNEEQWGYWERVPQMLKSDDDSIVQKEQKSRIDDVTGNSCGNCGGGKCVNCGGGSCTTPSVVYQGGVDPGALAADKTVEERWIPPDVLQKNVDVLVKNTKLCEKIKEKPISEIDDMAYFRKNMFSPISLMEDAAKIYHCTRGPQLMSDYDILVKYLDIPPEDVNAVLQRQKMQKLEAQNPLVLGPVRVIDPNVKIGPNDLLS